MRKQLLFSPVFLTGLLSTSPRRAQEFRVGPISAAAASITSGYWEIPKRVDEATRIPIRVIPGATQGPALGLRAGIHGHEYSSILSLQHLRMLIDPRELKGTVILAQAANRPSFLRRTIYDRAVDEKNLTTSRTPKGANKLDHRSCRRRGRQVGD